jgi:hypothetical protein
MYNMAFVDVIPWYRLVLDELDELLLLSLLGVFDSTSDC